MKQKPTLPATPATVAPAVAPPSDYPTADLATPGRYPHKFLVGRWLVIDHVDQDHDHAADCPNAGQKKPLTIEELTESEDWASLPAAEIAHLRARLDAHERGEWHYIGIVVAVEQTWNNMHPREIGAASCWFIESDASPELLRAITWDVFYEAGHDTICLMRALTEGDPRERSRSRSRARGAALVDKD